MRFGDKDNPAVVRWEIPEPLGLASAFAGRSLSPKTELTGGCVLRGLPGAGPGGSNRNTRHLAPGRAWPWSPARGFPWESLLSLYLDVLPRGALSIHPARGWDSVSSAHREQQGTGWNGRSPPGCVGPGPGAGSGGNRGPRPQRHGCAASRGRCREEASASAPETGSFRPGGHRAPCWNAWGAFRGAVLMSDPPSVSRAVGGDRACSVRMATCSAPSLPEKVPGKTPELRMAERGPPARHTLGPGSVLRGASKARHQPRGADAS